MAKKKTSKDEAAELQKNYKDALTELKDIGIDIPDGTSDIAEDVKECYKEISYRELRNVCMNKANDMIDYMINFFLPKRISKV